MFLNALFVLVALHAFVQILQLVKERIMSELKSVSDLTVSVEKLEAAAKKNAERIAALEAAAVPPVPSEDNSAALDVLAARVDAVTAQLEPAPPVAPPVEPAPAA